MAKVAATNESWLEHQLSSAHLPIHLYKVFAVRSMHQFKQTCPMMTNDVPSQGWLAKHKSIITTYISIDNVYHITFGLPPLALNRRMTPTTIKVWIKFASFGTCQQHQL